MATILSIDATTCDNLDLTPVAQVLAPWIASATLLDHHQELQFSVQYPQPDEPVELPEIPAVRLWFLRLDAAYPWLPYLLDWQSGDLVRYAAMLVPHEFSQQEGLLFNPQALDLFVMHKLFVIEQWLRGQGQERTQTLRQMAEVFGYQLDESLFQLLAQFPL